MESGTIIECKERSAMSMAKEESLAFDKQPTMLKESTEDGGELSVSLTENITENYSLRSSDEIRIAAALVDSSRKRKTGSVFSVEVNLSSGEMV